MLAVLKLLGHTLTGSSAILSDGLESFVNVLAAAALLFSLRVSLSPADRNHPFGHGKAEYLSVGFEGSMILVAAVLIFVQAGSDLLRGPELQRFDAGLALVAAAAVGNGLLASHLTRSGRRHGSPALIADGRHLWTDVLTSAGVLLSLSLVWISGWLWLDPVVAMLVALHILRTGWKLVREAIGGLLDEADPGTLARLVEILQRERRPTWIDLHDLRTFQAGPNRHVDLHMVVPRYLDVDALRRETAELEHALLPDGGADQGSVIARFDPCRPRHCASCPMDDCPIREHPRERLAPFELDRAIRRLDDLGDARPDA